MNPSFNLPSVPACFSNILPTSSYEEPSPFIMNNFKNSIQSKFNNVFLRVNSSGSNGTLENLKKEMVVFFFYFNAICLDNPKGVKRDG